MNDIIMYRFHKEGNCIWFVDRDTRGLFCFDLIEKKTRFIAKIPDITYGKVCAVSSILLIKDTLVLSPRDGEIFLLYKMKDETFTCIKIGKKYVDNYIAGIRYSDCLYFFGAKSGRIVKYNSIDDKCEIIRTIENIIQKNADMDKMIFRGTIAFDNDTIFFPNFRDNYLITYNISTDTTCIYYEGKEDEKIFGIFADSNGQQILVGKRREKSWVMKIYSIKENGIEDLYTTKKITTVNYPYRINNNILIFEMASNQYEVIDIKNKKECLKEIPSISNKDAYINKYGMYLTYVERDKDLLYAFYVNAMSLCVIDSYGNLLNEYKIGLSGKDWLEFQKKCGIKIINEEVDKTLDMFLECIY